MMNFVVNDQRDLLQLDRVHAFLSANAYWCLGIPYETVAKAAVDSLCFGAYRVMPDAASLGTRSGGADDKPITPLEQVGKACVAFASLHTTLTTSINSLDLSLQKPRKTGSKSKTTRSIYEREPTHNLSPRW